MFSERMALEATLRRQRVTSEAQTNLQLRPYRRTPHWQGRLLSRLGDLMVAKGTALQRRYRRAVEPAGRANSRRLEDGKQGWPRHTTILCPYLPLFAPLSEAHRRMEK